MLALPKSLVFSLAFLHNVHAHVAREVRRPQGILFVAQVDRVSQPLVTLLSPSRFVRLAPLVEVFGVLEWLNAPGSFVTHLVLGYLLFKPAKVQLEVFVDLAHFHELLLKRLPPTEGLLELGPERDLFNAHVGKFFLALHVLPANLFELQLKIVESRQLIFLEDFKLSLNLYFLL